MPANLQRARELFLHAVGALAPEQWDGYLAEACGSDLELQRQVAHLLQVHREAGSFLEQPAIGVGVTGAFTPSPEDGTAGGPAEAGGMVIGAYRLLEEIGEGGMGTVWKAEQTEPVKRLVAVKVIKAGMDSKQVLARFEAERQALALMDHPNQAAGKLDRAVSLLEETLKLRKERLGVDEPGTLSTMNALASAYQAAGKLDRALPLFRQAAEGVEKRRFQHPHASRIVGSLIESYERLEQPEKAEQWRRKWLAVAAPGTQTGLKADKTRVPAPVALLRTPALLRDNRRPPHAAALHVPHVYVLDRIGDLWIFKLPDQASQPPQQVGHVIAAGDGNALVVIGDTLLCSRYGCLEAYSLEDPVRPRSLGKWGPESPYQTWSLVRCQDRLIRVGPGALSVFDVSRPATPRHLATTPAPGWSANGCVVGGRLYVAEQGIASMKKTRNGIAIYDLAGSGALKAVGFMGAPAPLYHLLPVGKDRLAVLMDGKAQLFSLAHPLEPAALGQPVAASARCAAVDSIDGKSYLITTQDVLRIEEKGLVSIGGFRAGATYGVAPYHGGSEGEYAVISLDEAVVVLRPQAAAAARLIAPR